MGWGGKWTRKEGPGHLKTYPKLRKLIYATGAIKSIQLDYLSQKAHLRCQEGRPSRGQWQQDRRRTKEEVGGGDGGEKMGFWPHALDQESKQFTREEKEFGFLPFASG